MSLRVLMMMTLVGLTTILYLTSSVAVEREAARLTLSEQYRQQQLGNFGRETRRLCKYVGERSSKIYGEAVSDAPR